MLMFGLGELWMSCRCVIFVVGSFIIVLLGSVVNKLKVGVLFSKFEVKMFVVVFFKLDKLVLKVVIMFGLFVV